MTLQIFQGDFQENTQILLVQEGAIAVDLEYPLSEIGSKQGGGALGVKRVRLLLWATMAARMITSSRSINCAIVRVANY